MLYYWTWAWFESFVFIDDIILKLFVVIYLYYLKIITIVVWFAYQLKKRMAVSFHDAVINIYIQLIAMYADDTAIMSKGTKGYRKY